MDWEGYKTQVLSDGKDAIDDGREYNDTWDEMYDSLFLDDSVTGNASGSYPFNTARAKENVAGIVFDEHALDAFKCAGYEGIPTDRGAETCDVIARCIALEYVSDELRDYYYAA